MDSEVFKLFEVSDKQVILRVHADSAIACARHPYVDADMVLITVTRGRNHTLSVFDRNGRRTCDFDWGDRGRTVIDETLESLRRHVVDFILGQGVLLDSQSDRCTSARMYWNSSYKSWQLACETPAGSTNFWFGGEPTEQGFRQAKKEMRELFPGIRGFERTTCATGIPIWAVKFGRYGLKVAPAKASAELDPALERACAVFRAAAEYADLPEGCRITIEAKRLENGAIRICTAVSDPDEAIYAAGYAPSCEETFKPGRDRTLSAGDAFRDFAGMLEEGRGAAASMPKGLRRFMADAARRSAEACSKEEEEADAGPSPR